MTGLSNKVPDMSGQREVEGTDAKDEGEMTTQGQIGLVV